MQNLLERLPLADFRYLCENILGIPLYQALAGDFVKVKGRQKLSQVIKGLDSGLPFEYIVSESSFFGLDFKVEPSVLIPRKETEFLAEAAVRYINRNNLAKVLDLGTGSGNIGISVAKNTKAKMVVCSDICEVFKIAEFNRQRHKAVNVRFVRADLLAGFKYNSFDIIVSNPPYVESTFLNSAPSLRFEPSSALEAGRDGLLFIRRIINQAYFFLKDKGFLLLEIGFGQAEKTKQIALSTGKYKILEVIKDYSGIERVIILQKNG